MPKLLEQKEIRLDWSDIANRRYRKPKKLKRSTGVHLSGVIKYCLGLGDQDPDEMPLCMAVGMAVEDWLIGLWPEIEWQPGEMVRDEVYATPDGKSLISLDEPFIEEARCIDEFKATWMSRRTHGADITKETKYMWQLAGNCHMADCTYARLHVLWVCGEYKFGPPKPEYFTYLLQFSEEELTKFWRGVVLANKDCVPMERHD